MRTAGDGGEIYGDWRGWIQFLSPCGSVLSTEWSKVTTVGSICLSGYVFPKVKSKGFEAAKYGTHVHTWKSLKCRRSEINVECGMYFCKHSASIGVLLLGTIRIH